MTGMRLCAGARNSLASVVTIAKRGPPQPSSQMAAIASDRPSAIRTTIGICLTPSWSKASSSGRTSSWLCSVESSMPLPRVSIATTRSRLVITSRPSATWFSPRIASRITA
jgi:hypothetical protein